MNLFDGNKENGMKDGLHGVRPEHINIVKSGGVWEGEITHIERLGPNAIIYLNTSQCGSMVVSTVGDADVSVGQTISLSPDKEKMCFFNH